MSRIMQRGSRRWRAAMLCIPGMVCSAKAATADPVTAGTSGPVDAWRRVYRSPATGLPSLHVPLVHVAIHDALMPSIVVLARMFDASGGGRPAMPRSQQLPTMFWSGSSSSRIATVCLDGIASVEADYGASLAQSGGEARLGASSWGRRPPRPFSPRRGRIGCAVSGFRVPQGPIW